MQRSCPRKGFTLIELLIYLMILGLLFSFVTPTALKLLQHNQQQVIQDTLGGAIRKARIQALLTGETWVLAPLSEDNNWAGGIGLYSLDSYKMLPRKPYYQWAWAFEKISVAWHGFQSHHALYFTRDPGRNAVNGTFFIQVAKEPQLKITVNRLGYVH